MALHDMLVKLKSYLPLGWFPNPSPATDIVMTGAARSAQMVDDAITYVTPQLRIRTATEGVLDLISGDFFGNTLPRFAGESDDDYRLRILVALYREQGTRGAMSNAIGTYTGVHPIIKERGQAIDPTGYIITSGSDTNTGYGEVVKPYHCFIQVYMVSESTSTLNTGGYGSPCLGYSTPSMGQYIPGVPKNLGGLFELINSVKPVGTKIWVRTIISDLDTLISKYGITTASISTTLCDQWGGILSDEGSVTLSDSTYTQGD